MHFCVIGAGSMGSLYGGMLARAGFDVTLFDVWQDHVDAIRRDGLHLDGITGDLRIPIRATSRVAEVPTVRCAIILTDANATREASGTARRVLADTGFALTRKTGSATWRPSTRCSGRAVSSEAAPTTARPFAGPGM